MRHIVFYWAINKVDQIYNYISSMTIITDYYSTAALVFSIVSLSVAPLLPLFFRHYFRGLQFLQMCYLFASVLNTSTLSYKLTTAMVSFDKNILTFCTTGDYVCSNGFALSVGAILSGLLLITFIFVSIQKCCGKAIEYEPVFITFKGFIKWIYVPLVYTSTKALLSLISLTTVGLSLTTLLPPAIVLGFLALFPFFQLIAKKASQKQNANIWQKWLQFFGYLRLLATAVLVALSAYYLNDLYLHLIMITVILCPIMQLWKGNFKYPVMQRIIFFLGEAAFITLYFIFRYRSEYISSYNLDFYGLGGIILIDLLLYFVRTIRLACYGMNEGSNVVNPETPEAGNVSAAKIEDSTPVSPRKNKYQHDSGQQLQNSRDEIQGLNKKNNLKRRR